MEPGDHLIRWTVRLALLLYAVTLVLRFGPKTFRRAALARLTWTAGCLLYLAHVACAFHFVHHWSHAAAYEATARDSAALFGLNWGGGIYINYAFTLAWIADAAWWWARRNSYETRPRWLEISVQGFFVFMAFNGAVVFASGATRWISAFLFFCLAASLWRARPSQ
jgi:hypothetical protein